MPMTPYRQSKAPICLFSLHTLRTDGRIIHKQTNEIIWHAAEECPLNGPKCEFNSCLEWASHRVYIVPKDREYWLMCESHTKSVSP